MSVQKMPQKEIRWKTSFLLISIYLCFSFFLISCYKPGIPDFKPDPDIILGDISDRLVARIYFDATLSMQGFVVPGSTRYTQICPYLESVIVSGWRDERVTFFRFGEKIESIDRRTYLQAGYESFYEEEDIFGKTYIEKVIENEAQFVNTDIGTSSTPENTAAIDANDTPQEAAETDNTEGQLVVIVTDLFQDDGDITQLIGHLKEKYIREGHDVGLFGLRSQFDGTVHDIGSGEGSSLRYRSTPGNPETFRPFYLLILGKHADIAHYFDRLIANGFSDAHTVIFSRYLVNPLVSFDGASIELDNLNNKSFISSEDPRLKQYEIVKISEPAKISAKMEYVPLPHAMPFNSNTFEDPIIAEHKGEHKPDRNRENERSSDAMDCLEVTPTFSENELTVEFALTTSLPRKAVYLYEVTLHPAIDTYKVPDWCSDWNMGAERNGAKTLNLVNFVRGLTETTVRDHPPKIAQFYFYIKKR